MPLREAQPANSALAPTSVPHLVVLTAGEGRRLWPLTLTTPKALLSVGGRPAVFHALGQLFDRGLRHLTFVVSPMHLGALERTVELALANSPVQVDFVEQDRPRGPGHALSLAAPFVQGPVVVLLADTLCTIPDELPSDWLGVASVSRVVQHAYCMVHSDGAGFLHAFSDKPSEPVDGQAAVGLYGFGDAGAFCRAAEVAGRVTDARTGEVELRPLIDEYRSEHPVELVEVAGWRDIGTSSSYRCTVRDSLPGRWFTELSVSPTGWITKRSPTAVEVIADESAWFSAVPDDVLELVPRRRRIGNDGYDIEYVEYPTLAELFAFGSMESGEWPGLIHDLVETLSQALWRWTPTIPDIAERCRLVYRQKTLDRLRAWDRHDLLTLDEYSVNGRPIPGFRELWSSVDAAVEALGANAEQFASFIHGDLTFGNILLSPHARIFRLIDPRGNFGGRDAFGDLRYEAAKLRQCYHGLFDIVVADLFSVEEVARGSFRFSLFPRSRCDVAAVDGMVAAMGVDMKDVRLIEGLLFLSMIPLHADAPRRQLAFFVLGLDCLESCISGYRESAGAVAETR